MILDSCHMFRSTAAHAWAMCWWDNDDQAWYHIIYVEGSDKHTFYEKSSPADFVQSGWISIDEFTVLSWNRCAECGGICAPDDFLCWLCRHVEERGQWPCADKECAVCSYVLDYESRRVYAGRHVALST